MVDQYIVGVFIATLFAFVFLSTTRRRTKRSNVRKYECIKSSAAAPSDTDVVIVGAGVAGAALAYTLAKVIHYFFQMLVYNVRFVLNCN